MRCLIVHNPASGPRSDELFDFCRVLAQAGDEVVMRLLGAQMSAKTACEDASSFDRIVVSGGDGTVSNVLDCLRYSEVPILVFPSGTANLFFNNIGNASEPAALAGACRAGRCVQVDMGELFWEAADGSSERHGFIIIAGTGVDADIMHKAEPNKADMGEVAYFLSALSSLTPPVAHFTIEHDGRVDEFDGIGCMVGNTAVIQNDINLFPDCRMDDGLIDIAVIEPTGAVQLLPTIIAGVLDPGGTALGRPGLKLLQTREVKITCTPTLDMQFDGELITNNSGVFGARALPRCLNIIVDQFAKMQPPA